MDAWRRRRGRQPEPSFCELVDFVTSQTRAGKKQAIWNGLPAAPPQRARMCSRREEALSTASPVYTLLLRVDSWKLKVLKVTVPAEGRCRVV